MDPVLLASWPVKFRGNSKIKPNYRNKHQNVGIPIGSHARPRLRHRNGPPAVHTVAGGRRVRAHDALKSHCKAHGYSFELAYDGSILIVYGSFIFLFLLTLI